MAAKKAAAPKPKKKATPTKKKKPAKKKTAGQGVKHRATAGRREMVEAMSAYGIPQQDIANVLKIDKKTLLKHYRDELDLASAKANAAVAGKLYKKAMAGCTTSMIFWLKTRARWSEKIVVDSTVTNTGAVTHTHKKDESWDDPMQAAAEYQDMVKNLTRH